MFSPEVDPYIGPLAGIATSLLWTGTALFFTAAGRRIGPTAVNASRLALAIVLHGSMFHLLSGHWIPGIESRQVLYLALSGVIGLSLGDQALFTALVDIGPRLAMLMMTTSPLFAALFGRIVLGESLTGMAWIGIMLTISGVAWVVLERKAGDPVPTPVSRPFHTRGIVLALMAAGCQAGGLLLSKQGMGHGWLPRERHLDPQAATLVRMVFAGVGMLPILAIRWRTERRRRASGLGLRRIGSMRSGLMFMACGAVVGPFLGVWMSLVASDRAPLGIAQTLCSLPPLFILPFVIVIYKERVSMRAALGAVLAVSGSTLLFFSSG